jgi:threonyl-tRNA synthetase
MCIVGAKEQADRTVSVRHRTAGDAGVFGIDEVVRRLAEQRDSRSGEPAFVPAAANA